MNIVHTFRRFVLLNRPHHHISAFLKFGQIFKHFQLRVVVQIRSPFVRPIELPNQLRE